jgi:glycosyltransferase involved in cell wall biosynthesis
LGTIDIKVIIPAFNEENSVGKVILEIPEGLVSEIIVVNNASTDRTEVVANSMGATVLKEPRRGYGNACLKGIRYLEQLETKTDIVVFLDADYSDFPEEMPSLVSPIIHDDFDLVIGSRSLGNRQSGSMTIPQVFGNWLATTLLKLLYGANFTDLGPFRAIRYQCLLDLEMHDQTYGWTVEMQLKAAKYHLKCTEVPVNYRVRTGKSKISGTVKGTLMAGYKILLTIFKYL